MKISNIKIRTATDEKGLAGFASCVLEDVLFIGNIAIFSRLNRPGEYRVVFPVKDCQSGKRIEIFYPLTSEFYFELEKAIVQEFIKI